MLDKLIAQVLQGMAGGAPAGGSGASPLVQILMQLLAGGPGGGRQPAGAGGLGGLRGGLAGRAGAGGAGGGNPLEQLATVLLGGGAGGGGAAAGGGGLGGLLAQLQGAGLGREADSWVSRGDNLPVDPERLTQAFGRERLEALAQEHGMDVDEMTAGLAAELPKAVDELTPAGRVPEAGELSDLLASFAGGSATT